MSSSDLVVVDSYSPGVRGLCDITDTAERGRAALASLRPFLPTSPAELQATMEVRQIPGGYRLLGWFDEDVSIEERQATGVVGFRRGFSWAWGEFIYIDDLSVLPSGRRRGCGTLLVQAVLARAKQDIVDSVHLDSGLGAERHAAHQLYESLGFAQTSAHFKWVPKQR